MQSNQIPRERQTDSEAPLRSLRNFVDLSEHLEIAAEHFGWNSNAVVSNANGDMFRFDVDAKGKEKDKAYNIRYKVTIRK